MKIQYRFADAIALSYIVTKPAYGLEIRNYLNQANVGEFAVSTAAIYHLTARLEQAGHIQELPIGDPQRPKADSKIKYYGATEDGKSYLAKLRSMLDTSCT